MARWHRKLVHEGDYAAEVEEADRLGVRPEELATAAVIDLLHRDEDDFHAAADYVLGKNRDLYQRLA